MIGDNLEVYTFEYIMELALSEVSDSMDKRQGSVIYDALAPACARLAELFMNMRNVYKDTSVDTATGEALDLKVAEQGLTRQPATYALKKASFVSSEGAAMQINLGDRFSTISDINPIIYYAESQYFENEVPVPGTYNLRCEVAGTSGNEYSGALTNITHIKGLALATMSDLVIPAQDEETDDELRSRYFDIINNKAYGGNIAQYNQMVRDIDGVGDLQIYPVWNGGGTVKLSIVDTEFNPCSSDFLTTLKRTIDPEDYSGKGVGIAPIGHYVTIVTPTETEIDVSMTINLSPGFTLSQVESLITTEIQKYFTEVKKSWGIENPIGGYSAVIYIARIVLAALQVPGVANATNIKLNGVAQDLTLTQSSAVQQIPKLGEVVINA